LHSDRITAFCGGSTKEDAVKRLALVGAVIAAVLVLAPVAATAGPDEHFVDVGTDTDPDFCGTGQQIDVSFRVRVNLWLMEGVEDFRKITQSGKVWFTNPDNGRTVLVRFSGLTTNVVTSGTEEGVHTHVFTTKGLPELIKLPNGPVLTRDAGLIVETVTVDENGEVIDYSATWNGPHPEAESGFDLFCDVMTGALGIE
jgi:hypothetical protein